MTDVAPLSVPHRISVVIPVYRGERTLAGVVAEVLAFKAESETPAGNRFLVTEILLVHDRGPDGSARVIRQLAEDEEVVRAVWMSRNYGQHAATLAGMASSGGEWIVTLDEDGQHDPVYIGSMLDRALDQSSGLVYARPTNEPPHGVFRNSASRSAKWFVKKLNGGSDATIFNSYRLMLGEVGRSVAAYAGAGVFLDIALSWIVDDPTTAPVEVREEGGRASGYSTRTLMSHFWRMVLTGGTRALRLVSVLGALFAVLGVVIAAYLIINRLSGSSVVQGWTSLAVVLLLCTGAILFSLGVIAEYLGVAVNMAMGKPLYLITNDPELGPLGRRQSR